MTRRADERGAGTVLALAFLGVLVLVGAALGVVAAMVAEHRRAQSAADLAALAAAAALADGDDACAAGESIALANGAVLTSCVVEGDTARVIVEVTGPRWLGQSGDLRAEAAAGPASESVG